MNNKKMNCQVVCAEKSAQRIEGAMQMAHTQKSGADARKWTPHALFHFTQKRNTQNFIQFQKMIFGIGFGGAKIIFLNF